MTEQDNLTYARVLVTGAGGNIGRATTQGLVDAGIPVTAIDREYPEGSPADRVLTGDVCDVATVADALEGCDGVVHLAAIPTPHHDPPYEVFRLNVNSTFNVLSQAAERGILRAVQASSINAVGVIMNEHDVLPAYFPIDESMPTDIADAYSLSKQTAESIADMVWRKWGMSVLSLRFPLTQPAAALRAAAKRAAENPLDAVREGWAYLDVRDAVRVIQAGLMTPFDGPPACLVAARGTLLDRDTADLLAEYAPEVEVRGELSGRATLIDTSRLEGLLGFEPAFNLYDGTMAPEFDDAQP